MPQRSGVEAERGAPVLLQHGDRHLQAVAGVAVGAVVVDVDAGGGAVAELTPAAAELAGAGSGVVTLGPVSQHLDALTAALRHHP